MNHLTVRRLVLTAVLLAPSSAAWAHHSYAMYDQTRKMTLQGTVKVLEWTNPHIWVWVDCDDGKGSTTTYGFESNAPSELTRFFGWNKHILNVGDKVTVDYAPLKSGNNGGALRTITFADGRMLLTPRSDPQYVVGSPSTKPSGGNEAK